MPVAMSYVLPVVMLAVPNVFMTLAWYAHLKFKATPLLIVILVSSGIAFIEYCLAVPANRKGHAVYSAAQLKTIEEVLTLNTLIGFGFILAGAVFVFREREKCLCNQMVKRRSSC